MTTKEIDRYRELCRKYYENGRAKGVATAKDYRQQTVDRK